ncbi:MAG: hypothetical protein ABSF09_06155 [Candidatus Bathyarchaeia archaeon]
MPKRFREQVIECSSITGEGLLKQYVKKEFDLVKISNMTSRPILTNDHKEYWVIDGSVVYIYSREKAD